MSYTMNWQRENINMQSNVDGSIFYCVDYEKID